MSPPEYAWWEFDIDDITSGKGDFMKALTDSTDPDLTRFLKDKSGKLLLYHGWGDATAQPEPTLDYFNAVVATTFPGDAKAAHDAVRLFMAPGMGHCGGGLGRIHGIGCNRSSTGSSRERRPSSSSPRI